MSELVERMRARLSEKRLAKPERIQEISDGNYKALGHTSKGNCADNNNCGYSTVANVELLGASRDYEGARADLRIACCLYLRARHQCYIDYQTAGIAVFRVLVGDGLKWFRSYCIEPYPDICYCGEGWLGNLGALRRHCPSCSGENEDLAYVIQQLACTLRIHYSWVEYGFAYALKQVGPYKRRKR